MKLNLPDSVSSLQDLNALILELRDYKRWFAHAAIKKQVHAGRTGGAPELSKAAQQLLTAEKATATTQIDELIHSLERYVHSAPSLTITLAAPPTAGIKESLVVWCRKNISPNILVSFQFNSTLLGGMVIRYGSHIFDWSFRRQILAGKDKFSEVLRNV